MSNSNAPYALLAGGPAAWGRSAVESLDRNGLKAVWEPRLVEVVNRVRTDPAVSVVVFAEDQQRESILAGISRTAMVRPDLPMLVLAAKYDVKAMVKYLQLGQRETGVSRVRYLANNYDFDRLASLIRTEVCAVAHGPVDAGVCG